MFFSPKITVEEIEFNKAYKYFQEHTEVILLCVDEHVKFEENHPVDAQCFPLRLIKSNAKQELPDDCIYYVYALQKGTAYQGTKYLLQQGFKAYSLGSNVDFKGPEEGLNIKSRRRRR